MVILGGSEGLFQLKSPHFREGTCMLMFLVFFFVFFFKDALNMLYFIFLNNLLATPLGLVPQSGIKPALLYWKRGTLTTGPVEKLHQGFLSGHLL